MIIRIVIIILIFVILYLIVNRIKYDDIINKIKMRFNIKNKNIRENWRDQPFIGNKDTNTYHRPNLNYSSKSLPIYYPISSPLEDNYFDYLNSISSPKLSLLRNILRKVEIYTNQGQAPIIYNYAERPIDIKSPDKNNIKTLADTVINLINKFADPLIKVELDKTINELHEETDQQSKINFDMKIRMYYADSEKLGKTVKPEYDIIYIQPEFIFEKHYKTLPEDEFLKIKK